MQYIRGKSYNLLESSKVLDKTRLELSDQDFIGCRNFMEGKVENYLMKLQEIYYEKIGSTR